MAKRQPTIPQIALVPAAYTPPPPPVALLTTADGDPIGVQLDGRPYPARTLRRALRHQQALIEIAALLGAELLDDPAAIVAKVRELAGAGGE